MLLLLPAFASSAVRQVKVVSVCSVRRLTGQGYTTNGLQRVAAKDSILARRSYTAYAVVATLPSAFSQSSLVRLIRQHLSDTVRNPL